MWTQYLGRINAVLTGLIATDRQGGIVGIEDAFRRWSDMAAKLGGKAGTIHLIGNGASASMASHFAADITKNCGLRATVFTDCALVTAIGNDNGYENVYSVALERYAAPGDLLVAISSSGNSPNIVNACREARRLGVNVVTVSGKRPDNALRILGDLNIYAPAENFSLAESAHAVILHHWTDRLEESARDNAGLAR